MGADPGHRQAADHHQQDADHDQEAAELGDIGLVEEPRLGVGERGGTRPRCSQAPAVSWRPREVRANSPICIRYGSITSSSVSMSRNASPSSCQKLGHRSGRKKGVSDRRVFIGHDCDGCRPIGIALGMTRFGCLAHRLRDCRAVSGNPITALPCSRGLAVSLARRSKSKPRGSGHRGI